MTVHRKEMCLPADRAEEGTVEQVGTAVGVWAVVLMPRAVAVAAAAAAGGVQVQDKHVGV